MALSRRKTKVIVRLSVLEQLATDVARLRLTMELMASGIGGLLEEGLPSPARTRERLIELYDIASATRNQLGVQTHTTVENVLERHADDPALTKEGRMRYWAAELGIALPILGPVPRRVRDLYDLAHPEDR